MKKTKNAFMLLMLLFAAVSFTACGDDDDDIPSSNNTKDQDKKLSKPEVKVSSHAANGSYDGWWVIGTVTTGGDDPANVDCYLEWEKFYKKQSGNVTLTNRDRMNVTNSSKTRVQFKKEHAGVSKGTYIYYRLVGSNSKYSASTSTTYMVAL